MVYFLYTERIALWHEQHTSVVLPRLSVPCARVPFPFKQTGTKGEGTG